MSIETDIKEKKIAFFVNNIQATSKTVSRLVKLAKQNNVPVLNVTETLLKAKTIAHGWWTNTNNSKDPKIKQQQAVSN